MSRLRRQAARQSRPHLIVALTCACALASHMVPNWQSEVRASNYGAVLDDSLRLGEEDLEEIRRRLSSQTVAPGPWGAFLTFDYDDNSRRQTMNENGFDERVPGFTVGVDKLLTDRFLLGGQFSYKSRYRDYDDPANPDKDNPKTLGTQETQDFAWALTAMYSFPSISLVSPWIPDLIEGAYLQATVGYAFLNIDTKRPDNALTQPARGETNGDRALLSGSAGYDWIYHRWGAGLVGSVNYIDTWIDGYRETGAAGDESELLVVRSRDASRLTFDVGAKAQYNFTFSWGNFIPEARIHYVYRDIRNGDPTTVEFQDGDTEKFPTDPPDRDAIKVGATLRMVLPNYWQVWLDYERTLLDRHEDNFGIRLGIRKQF